MSEIGHNSKTLREYIERIERLEEDVQETRDEIRDVYIEAASKGLDKKALKEIVRLRKKDLEEVAAHEAVVDAYKVALGMQMELPLAPTK